MGTDAIESTLSEILQSVRTLPLAGRRLADDMMSGGHRSALRGAGIEFGEVRDYVPGDDPRAVDPSVTARMGRLFVKRFVDERERTVIGLVDVRAGMDCGFGVWSLRDAAMRMLACVAWSAVKSQDRFALLPLGGDRAARPIFGKGVPHFTRQVRACLLARPGTTSATSTAFAATFESVMQAPIRRSLLVIVTDGLDLGDEARWHAVAHRHDLVVVRLRPPERRFPDVGPLRVTVADVARLLPTQDPAWRATHDEAWRRADDAFTDFMRRVGVDPVVVDVPGSPALDGLLQPLIDRFVRRRAEARA